MSHVPPRRRNVPRGSPSSSQNVPTPIGKLPKRRIPLRRSEDYIRTIHIAPEISAARSSRRVQFVRFKGDTFGHLQGIPLYTLKGASTAEVPSSSKDEKPSDPDEKIITIVGSTENKAAVKSFMETIRPDLAEKLRSCTQLASTSNRFVPTMWLRFGKLLLELSQNMRGRFDWEQICTVQSLEEHLRNWGPLKASFDTSLPCEEFALLHEMAKKNALQRSIKEEIGIQVEDADMPGALLQCLCPIVEGSNYQEHAKLKITKVKLSPVRHMIADAACVGKRKDIRIMLNTEEHLRSLTEEEKADLDSILSNVSIDENEKGGLCWPLGSNKRSASGRFQAVGYWHKRRTIVTGTCLKWHLGEVNRAEFKASTGRITYEVNVRPAIFNEFRKGLQEWNVDVLMEAIEELLAWIWQEL